MSVCETFSTSDHSYILFQLDCPIPAQFVRWVRDYRNAGWSLVRAALAALDWDEGFCNLDSISQMWSFFKSTIESIIASHIPRKKISHNRNNAPWFDKYLQRLVRVKQRRWRKYRASRCQRDLTEYRNTCKLVHKKVIEARGRYERNKFSERNCNPRAFFNYISNRTGVKSGVSPLRVDGVEHELVYDFSQLCPMGEAW